MASRHISAADDLGKEYAWAKKHAFSGALFIGPISYETSTATIYRDGV